MRTSPEIGKLIAALVAAKKDFNPVVRDRINSFLSKDGRTVKYADLAGVIEATEGSLLENGLLVVQAPASKMSESGTFSVGVQSTLFHTSGEFIEHDPFFLPLGKTDAQTGVAAVTYARRTSYSAILSVAAEDDDGNAASGKSGAEPFPKTRTEPVAKASKSVAPVKAPANTSPVPENSDTCGPEPPAGGLPSPEEFSGYRQRGKDFCNNLRLWGMEGDVSVKLTKYFNKTAGASRLDQISKQQWDSIWETLSTPLGENGGQKMVADIEAKLADQPIGRKQ